MLSYVVNLYAEDLNAFPDAVSLDRAHPDWSGYSALGRTDALNQNHPKDRQLNFFGGLRWRYEKHVPLDRRKIDRTSLFRAKPGLALRSDFTFSDEKYNGYACPQHHNTAIARFRAAKTLKTNSGSKFDIHGFQWHGSIPFLRESQQSMDLGLMDLGLMDLGLMDLIPTARSIDLCPASGCD